MRRYIHKYSALVIYSGVFLRVSKIYYTISDVDLHFS